MAKVKFFASLKDLVGLEEIEVDVVDHQSLLSELERHLSVEGFDAICAASVKIAVNHEIVEPGFVIRQNDEIAFLPPITGG